jgi:hypothetical protein
MKKRRLAGWGLAAALAAVCATPPGDSNAASDSMFEKGVRIEADGVPITGEVGHLVPSVADWNNDGKKDLIVASSGEARSLYT